MLRRMANVKSNRQNQREAAISLPFTFCLSSRYQLSPGLEIFTVSLPSLKVIVSLAIQRFQNMVLVLVTFRLCLHTVLGSEMQCAG